MRRCLLSTILIIKYMTCVGETEKKHYIRDYKLPSLYSSNTKSIVKLRSKLECANHCTEDSHCTTFSFDLKKRQCTKAPGNQVPKGLGYGPRYVTYPWKLKLYTSDMIGSETSADIYVKILGKLERNSTAVFFRKRFLFDTPENDFQSNSVDTMSITTNFPIPTHLRIKNVRFVLNNDWHMKKAVMINDRTGEKITFPWNKWIKAGEPEYTIVAQ